MLPVQGVMALQYRKTIYADPGYPAISGDTMIDGKTKLYGIIGNPVSHSLSPAMQNAAFAERAINGVYIPFR